MFGSHAFYFAQYFVPTRPSLWRVERLLLFIFSFSLSFCGDLEFNKASLHAKQLVSQFYFCSACFRGELVSGDETKTMAPQRRLLLIKLLQDYEKKTERKPAENTSHFASKANAVIASLFPNYTPAFFRKFH